MKSDERVTNVLRVAVANNFNFTQKELEALDDLGWDKDKLFVNSNSFVTIKSDYPSFITVNPYLDSFVEPVGDLTKVRACRIKVVYSDVLHPSVIDSLYWCGDHNVPALITFMRFSCKESLRKYSNLPDGYVYSGGYYRLKKEAKYRLVAKLHTAAVFRGISEDLIHYCDLAELGCPSCGNCAKLAFPDIKGECNVYGVNLSASGDDGRCIFHCPDCWAKKLQKIGRYMATDKISQNTKQKGHK